MSEFWLSEIANYGREGAENAVARIEQLEEELRWIAAFADVRANDDSKTFARVNRGALRTTRDRASAQAAGRYGAGMTCIRTSAPTERALCDPKYRTSWQREKRDGRIQANDNLVTMGKRINSTRIALVIGLFAVVVFGREELRAIASHRSAALRAEPVALSQAKPAAAIAGRGL